MTVERNPDGTYKKGGKSPNPKGRGKDVKNKTATLQDLRRWTGRRQEGWLSKIEELGNSTYHPYIVKENAKGESEVKPNPLYDPKMSFNCFKELNTTATQLRQEEDKKRQDSKGGKGASNSPSEAPPPTGALSLINNNK